MTSLERPLATRARKRASMRGLALKVGASFALIALLGFLASRVDLRHDLHRMRVRVLSGDPAGNYHAVVGALGAIAARQHGVVNNVASAGSTENVRRLVAAARMRTCDVDFGLVQDGTDGVTSPGLELVGRLPAAESVLFYGRDAARITELAQLRGLRVGVGPEGSGTARVATELFALPELAALGVVTSHHRVVDQLELAQRGELDLAMMVMDEHARLVAEAFTRRGLQLASFAHAEAIARRLPHLTTGTIAAGAYDAVRVLPPTDVKVMQVETLVIGNHCAGRVATIDLLTVLSDDFPDFLRHNDSTPNDTGLPLSPVAREYIANGGPQVADEYAPWLVDVMPPANWAYVVMGVSLLFNAMGFGHRFRLWRIDASRVRLEGDLTRFFTPTTTLGDIRNTAPSGKLLDPEVRTGIAHVIAELESLAARSRRYSLSMLVPMGQEMAYRYQEGIIYETLAILRDLARRIDEAKAKV